MKQALTFPHIVNVTDIRYRWREVVEKVILSLKQAEKVLGKKKGGDLKKLMSEYVQLVAHDVNLAEEWFPLEEEAWRLQKLVPH